MKNNTNVVPLLCLLATSLAGCGVAGLESESEEETISAEQAVKICGHIDCGGKDPQQAVREMGRGLGHELFQGREGLDEERAGTLILQFALRDPQPVSVPERKQICDATGGRFAYEVEVTECRDGTQTVTPRGDRRFQQGAADDGQPQRCVAGTGHTYSNQCVYLDKDGLYFFDDGPSIDAEYEPWLPGRVGADEHRYSVLFWEAGQRHDYCYHHTPTYGFRRELCDDDFDNKMHQICENVHSGLFDVPGTSLNRGSCKLAAKAMAAAVRYHPKATEAYHNMKTFVRYMEPRELPKPELPDDHTESAPPAEPTCSREGEVPVQGSCVCPPEPVFSCTAPLRWVDVPGSCGRCELDTER
jgi:hypothetical protein